MSYFRANILSMAIIFFLAGCSSAPIPKEPVVMDKEEGHPMWRKTDLQVKDQVKQVKKKK